MDLFKVIHSPSCKRVGILGGMVKASRTRSTLFCATIGIGTKQKIGPAAWTGAAGFAVDVVGKRSQALGWELGWIGENGSVWVSTTRPQVIEIPIIVAKVW